MAVGKNGLVSINSDTTVVYKLSDSEGKTLKTYSVPKDRVEEFQETMEKEREEIEQQIHSSVSLVKVEKIFG